MASNRTSSIGATEVTSPQRPSRSKGRTSIPWSLGFVDAGIAASLLITPFVMGGRSPAGQLVFALLAFWAFFWWSIHQATGQGNRHWHRTFAYLPLITAVAFATLQIIPLPSNFISVVSPRIYEILPLWSNASDSQATLGTWHTISLTPDASRVSLTLLASGILLFTVTVQRVQHVRDVERIIRWVAISVSLMAGFGIVQFLASNGKFFWVYESPYCHTSDCVKGAFTNRNHFAQYIALGFGPLLWWTVRSLTVPSRCRNSTQGFQHESHGTPLEGALKFLLVPLCILAALMSFSRGGILALAASGATAVFLLWWAGQVSKRLFMLLTGCILIACIGLSIYGYEGIAGRFETDQTQASLDGRSRIWAAARAGLADYVATGTGLSSHEFVYPMYLEPEPGDENLRYTHAENGYIQLALETGILGLGLALVSMSFCFFWCAATLRRELEPRVLLCFVAILPPLLANAVHSAVDFVWYVPGCMAPVAILAGCACRLYHLEGRMDKTMVPRPVPGAMWACVSLLTLCAVCFAIPELWRSYRAEMPWNRFLLYSRSLTELDHDASYQDAWERTEQRRLTLVAMSKELSAVLEARPDWARAHACKAGVHLQLFNEYQLTADNSFDLRQIRETVLSGGFESADAVRDWLTRAVGDHRSHLKAALTHAHQAVALGPLQGDAYALLAQLTFLEDPSAPTKGAYIDQAYRVRPYDGTVLFAAGEEAGLANQPELALSYWKRSFRCGWQSQQRLIELLAGRIPARELFRIFSPDADSAFQIARYYEREDLKPELDVVLTGLANAAEAKAQKTNKLEANRYWKLAAKTYARLNNHRRQMCCLERAVKANATDYTSRYLLGRCQLELAQYSEAERHLRWCAQRNQSDQAVQRLLEEAVRQRIATGEPPKEARASNTTTHR